MAEIKKIKDYKTITAKIEQTDYTKLRVYCDKKKTTPSTIIRELIVKELEIPTPCNIAGRNIIEYDKEKDNFTWYVELDDGSKSEIMKNISHEFLTDLEKSILTATEQKSVFIRKNRKDSVPIPSAIVRRGKK